MAPSHGIDLGRIGSTSGSASSSSHSHYIGTKDSIELGVTAITKPAGLHSSYSDVAAKLVKNPSDSYCHPL